MDYEQNQSKEESQTLMVLLLIAGLVLATYHIISLSARNAYAEIHAGAEYYDGGNSKFQMRTPTGQTAWTFTTSDDE